MTAIPMVLDVPAIHAEGLRAALAGTRMSSLATPLGFTFCPYGPAQVIEHANWINGATQMYFDEAMQ